jgi:Xaa-Pro aminopeptidase
MTIGRAEYRERQIRFAAALAKAGLAGAVVVSRGGFTFDRLANVFYLSGHYQSYVFLPDTPPHWSGRAHTAIVVNNTAETLLCVSTPEYDPTAIVADEIRHGPSFAGSVVEAMRSLGWAVGTVGLVGGDVLPFGYAEEIRLSLPDLRWCPVDEIIEQQRRIKSPDEHRVIRRAARTNRRAMDAFRSTVVPGRTEAEAAAAATEAAMADGAALYYAAVSSGPMSWAYTSAPLPGFSRRRFESGDIVRVDLCIVNEGYYSDFGRTFVAGAASAPQQRLLDALHSSLDAVISAIQPGRRVPDITAAGDAALRAAGVALDGEPSTNQIVASYPAHWGHGLGLGWERPWMVSSETLEIEAGMYLAIERALTLAEVGTAAAEQNLLVGEGGAELLTAGFDDPWQ